MQINITFRYCLAFMAFVFVFGQLHEVAHLTAAFVVCGYPGNQADFKLWTLCGDCQVNPNGYIATIFGPVFSYLMMWTGYFLMRSSNKKYWGVAFVLILGNLPFARIFTAGMGGGDETTVLKTLFSAEPVWLIKTIGFLIVAGLAFPPIFMAYKRLHCKRKLLLIVTFCVAPMLIMMPYEFILLGKVLKSGFMADQHFLGIADFIYLHTLLMAMIVLIFRKTLFAFSK